MSPWPTARSLTLRCVHPAAFMLSARLTSKQRIVAALPTIKYAIDNGMSRPPSLVFRSHQEIQVPRKSF